MIFSSTTNSRINTGTPAVAAGEPHLPLLSHPLFPIQLSFTSPLLLNPALLNTSLCQELRYKQHIGIAHRVTATFLHCLGITLFTTTPSVIRTTPADARFFSTTFSSLPRYPPLLILRYPES
ncbi:hypothetical protein Anapl_05909 [Anas platyrhynchos]|uniref:Uncharacterized protein n=1 Tax=Anas platyrhynchos TaxID=8839 RepID=R0L574_ANAPL|nr:hypothetical protein Anapl_05909 [Anas platyrhynchos]